ncbi:ATP-dependent Lon protease pim1 [Stygiomarasmius scandens]|uniref:ATP-dependent Lon protease pim1 n=1 Tax=Marasmiellus scandens TaxID=2682957 RepID=A0ABR1IYE8_9AGAR
MLETVKKVFEEELNKLSTLEPSQSKANVTRNYLEWLITPFRDMKTIMDWKTSNPVYTRVFSSGQVEGTVEGKLVFHGCGDRRTYVGALQVNRSKPFAV